ncbi:MAG TPA: chorismate mutase [Candidatus Angelobacter sp.]|nr:chorismate mutase [Candidatus Angelobacter sp.]
MSYVRDVNAKSLQGWRREIDLLDRELLRLLNRRAEIACELAAIKVAAGLPAYDGRREQQVLDRVCAQSQGPLPVESVTGIFRRIILETRRIGTLAMRKQIGKWKVKEGIKEQSNGHQHGSRRV